MSVTQVAPKLVSSWPQVGGVKSSLRPSSIRVDGSQVGQAPKSLFRYSQQENHTVLPSRLPTTHKEPSDDKRTRLYLHDLTPATG
ncbi:hypothetical protein [Xenorhabdus bovienii]|uniref:hypothetical protein n=1 Tax=Xenorhabdus bovienii TaxID=40576 RepID=UPI00237C806C|nr:hypothetical protein [Xenorhabdus bovienii]MDE1476620.1 hypothetical protein [Xenorhabdus bovienii]